MRLLLFLEKESILLNETQRQTCLVSSSKSHTQKNMFSHLCIVVSGKALSYLLWGIPAASPIMKLNGISFAFRIFLSELFSTEDKNSESWTKFFCSMKIQFPKMSIFSCVPLNPYSLCKIKILVLTLTKKLKFHKIQFKFSYLSLLPVSFLLEAYPRHDQSIAKGAPLLSYPIFTKDKWVCVESSQDIYSMLW